MYNYTWFFYTWSYGFFILWFIGIVSVVYVNDIISTIRTNGESSRQRSTQTIQSALASLQRIQILIICMYAGLVLFYLYSWIPVIFIRDDCQTFNWIVENSDQVSDCSTKVTIGFFGMYSSGKTTILNDLLGHEYSNFQISLSPATQYFICKNNGQKNNICNE